jgi:predicted DNA-binding transcriptional regulator AlpA
MSRILRKREALDRLGVKKTCFYDLFIATGRIKPVKIGTRAVGYLEDEIDELIEGLRRERDRKPQARRRRVTEEATA